MNTIHSDPHVVEIAQELPMRKDLAQMPLNSDADVATAQIIMRQAVPIPLHEQIIKKIRSALGSLFRN